MYPFDTVLLSPARVEGIEENSTIVRAAAVDSEAGPLAMERIPALVHMPEMSAGNLQHDSGELKRVRRWLIWRRFYVVAFARRYRRERTQVYTHVNVANVRLTWLAAAYWIQLAYGVVSR